MTPRQSRAAIYLIGLFTVSFCAVFAVLRHFTGLPSGLEGHFGVAMGVVSWACATYGVKND